MNMGNSLDRSDDRKTDDQPHREQRAHSRAGQAVKLQILPCHPRRGSFGFVEAEQIDCSPEGIGLLVREQIPVGEPFLVKVMIGKPRLIAYTVRHCRAEGTLKKKYRIGGELVGAVDQPADASPDAILKALRGG